MDDTIHLGSGGPFDRLERRTHLKLRGLVLASIAVTWLPLVVLSAAEFAVTHKIDPLMRFLSVHARFLVAVPLLLFAQRLIDRTAGSAIQRLFDEGFVHGEGASRVRAALRSVDRICASSWPEIVMFGMAFVTSALGWSVDVHGPGISHALPRHGVVGQWLFFVSLPLFQFLLWRSLLRWALWVRLLFAVSRVPLRLLATHADRRGGIAFLKRPSVGYCAILLIAVSTVLVSSWANEVIGHSAPLTAFKSMFYVFVVVGAVVAFAPLLFFAPTLFALRHEGRRRFDELLSAYSTQFERRWFSDEHRDELLGTPDAQSLADLGNTYRECVDEIQVLLFGKRDAIALFIAAQIPALPFILAQPDAREALTHVLKLAVGG